MSALDSFFEDFVATNEAVEASGGESGNGGRLQEQPQSSQSSEEFTKWKDECNQALGDFFDVRYLNAGRLDSEDPLSEVPHVEEAVNDVKYVPDIDLNSRTVTLDILMATHTFPYRETGRFAVKITETLDESQHSETNDVLPRKRRAYCCDDGPLSTVFKHVISFETIQWSASDPLHDLATAAFQEGEARAGKSSSRLSVFFYSEWAREIDRLIQGNRIPDGASLLFSLKVPALLVLPFTLADWFDRESMLPYCLCIGDRSKISDTSEGGSKKYLRFDKDVRVSIGYKLNSEVKGWDIICSSAGDLEVNEQDPADANSLAEYCRVLEQSNTEKQPAQEEIPEPPSEPPEIPIPPTIRRQTAEPEPEVAEPPPPLGPQAPTRNNTAQVEYQTLGSLSNYFESYLHEVRMRTGNVGRPRSECLVNVYGVVLGFGCPARTRTGDWIVSMTLVDSSIQLDDPGIDQATFVHSVSLNLFVKQKEDIPDLQRAGDVIRAHRVRLQEWNNDMQLAGRKGSSYVVFRKGYNGFKAIPTAKLHFTMTEPEEKLMSDLWRWGQNRLSHFHTMSRDHSLRLTDVCQQGATPQDPFYSSGDKDMTVLVSAVIPYPETLLSASSPRGFLRIWDGTGLPQSDLPLVESQGCKEALSNGDPPVEVLISLAKLVQQLNLSRAGSDIEVAKSLTGRVCNAVVWEKPHWDLVTKSVEVGSFVRLRNASDEPFLDTGLQCLHVHAKSHVTPLPDNTFEVVQLLQAHNNRIKNKEPLNKSSGILPLETHPSPNTDTEVVDDPTVDVEINPSRLQEPSPSMDRRVTTIAGLTMAPVGTEARCAVRLSGMFPTVEALERSGVKHIIKNVDGPKFRFGVSLKDDSATQVDVIVSEKSEVGETIVGMKASVAIEQSEVVLENLKSAIGSDAIWQADIRAVEFNDSKFFLLFALEKV